MDNTLAYSGRQGQGIKSLKCWHQAVYVGGSVERVEGDDVFPGMGSVDFDDSFVLLGHLWQGSLTEGEGPVRLNSWY
jgi:hypothetical protein